METFTTPVHRAGVRTGHRATTPAEILRETQTRLQNNARSDTVSALDRGLTLLNCFQEGRLTLTAAELSRLSDIPRPTVIRLATTLVAHRWLAQEPGGEGYRLGAGVVSLAHRFLAGLDIRAAARAPMQALAEATAGSVYLAVRDGLEMVLIEACRARATMLSARLDVGSRVPLPNSALGRAYLGAVDMATRLQLIDSLRLSRGSDWAALEAGLQSALLSHQRSGYCISAGEFHTEINSVSVAMTGPDNQVMSFNCGGPAFSFSEARLHEEIAPALLAMARKIASDVGGTLAAPEQTYA
jgi:IclR family transcriptional regulator, positive regulator for flagellar biogenesis